MVLEGLPMRLIPYPHVPVGEPGRGRELVRFPVGQRFAESLREEGRERILRADVLRSRKGTLLLVEERRPEDPRAIVLVRIGAGYREVLGGTPSPPGPPSWRRATPPKGRLEAWGGTWSGSSC